MQFWTVFTFIVNALIFFFVGSSSVNFAIRTGDTLYGNEGLGALFGLCLYRLPIIWLISFALRFVFLHLSVAVLKLCRLSDGLTWQQSAFITVAGMRGALSLVLAQAIAAEQSDHALSDEERKVRAQMAILITGYVILTLLVNAPLCGPLLTLLKLDRLSEEQVRVHAGSKHSDAKAGNCPLTHTNTDPESQSHIYNQGKGRPALCLPTLRLPL